MTPARTAAYRVLRAVFEGDDLPHALARVRDALPDERDRALVTEMTSGTFRWLAVLDRVIEQAANRQTTRLDDDVLTVLRLGTYQLLYLERVPAAAAVHESVSLVRRVGKTSAAGLVNAVLRRIAADPLARALPPEPTGSDDRDAQLAYLSVTCSHPRWLVDRWLTRRGFAQAADWVRFNNTVPTLTLRANRLHTTAGALARQLAEHDVQTAPTRFARDGLTVLTGNPFRTPMADQGLFLVQDEASQLVAELVAPRPGDRVLDACAAPGGKTTALAAAVGSAGTVVASDCRPARVRLLRRTLETAGATAVRMVRLDLKRPPPFPPVFDRVLVDAPCSGLGIVRRDPEIRWRRSVNDLPRFAADQLALLTQAAAVVRPGGRLVYATCSSEPEENESVVATFLGAHPDFDAVPAAALGPLPGGLQRALDPQGRLTTTPMTHGLEAFFAVVLRRGPS